MPSLSPKRDIVAIRVLPDVLETDSPLVVVHERKAQSIRWREAEVIAVGPKVREVKPGDVVFLKPFIGNPAEHNGEPILLLPEDDLEAIKEP